MSEHEIGLFGLGLFLGYYLYIALNYREVRRARLAAPALGLDHPAGRGEGEK